jgi:hypothetical protein
LRWSPVIIAIMLALVAVPLTTSSLLLIEQRSRESDVLTVTRKWAGPQGWEVVGITTQQGKTVVRMTGPLPVPDARSLRAALASTGVDVSSVRAEFIPAQSVDFGVESPG